MGRGGPGGPGGPISPYAGGTRFGGPPGTPTGRLDLHLLEPQRQARWKTLLRGLLVLPNALVLALMEVAVTVVTVAMWFATLCTARVPEGLWRFSKGVLQWQARTYAYSFFLTDRYPPFETGHVSYPVWVTLERPERFNRLAVLFRLILVIPAGIVSAVFTSGAYAFSVITWLVTLVLGGCPRSLHLMLAAWLRYQLRYAAYYGLLTTEYPSAALGDRQSTFGSLEAGEIVLRGAAKGFAVAAIVLGVVLYFFRPALPDALGTLFRAQTSSAVSQWNELRIRTAVAESTFEERANRCAGTWRCLRTATAVLQHNVETQVSTIESIFPTGSPRGDADRVLSVLQEQRSALTAAQTASTQQALQDDLNYLATLTRKLQPLELSLRNDLGPAS
jgi:hypothetical protein